MNTIEWPSWPQYGPDERAAVDRVIRSNQLFAADEVRQFEVEYASNLGTSFALGLGNATEALHLALAALGIGVGDEVIVTPYSWISSASCVLMQNAVPVFCDIEPDTLGLDPAAVERKITDLTKAIIVVHMFGYPSRVQELAALARRHGIPLIEDASHAHGGATQGRRLGTFGTMSIFSLHQRKSLSVGDGGVLCTDDADLYESVRRLRSFGHDELSYNYRMTEFAGALGRVGLTKLEQQNERREENAGMLADLLSDADGVSVRLASEGDRAAYYAVLLDVSDGVADLDVSLLALQTLGIPIRKTWSPLHKHPHFNPTQTPARGLPWKHPDYNGDAGRTPYRDEPLPVANRYCPDRILELYVHPPAGAREIAFAADQIRSMLRVH